MSFWESGKSAFSPPPPSCAGTFNISTTTKLSWRSSRPRTRLSCILHSSPQRRDPPIPVPWPQGRLDTGERALDVVGENTESWCDRQAQCAARVFTWCARVCDAGPWVSLVPGMRFYLGGIRRRIFGWTAGCRPCGELDSTACRGFHVRQWQGRVRNFVRGWRGGSMSSGRRSAVGENVFMMLGNGKPIFELAEEGAKTKDARALYLTTSPCTRHLTWLTSRCGEIVRCI